MFSKKYVYILVINFQLHKVQYGHYWMHASFRVNLKLQYVHFCISFNKNTPHNSAVQ